MKARFTFVLVGLLVTSVDCQEKQKPEPGIGANDPRAWMPFETGARWKWHYQYDDSPPVTKEWRCIRRVRVGKKGESCWELRDVQGKRQGWTYRDARADGIYRFRNRYLGNMRGVSPSQKPTRLVPGPVGVTTVWKWTEMGSVQTSVGGSFPDPDTLRMHYTARIESMADPVEVPAGEFTAIRIGIEMKSGYFGNTEETLWIARGTGIVKRIIRHKKTNSRQVWRLQRFAAGTKPTGSPEQRIAKLLSGDTKLAELGAPDSLKEIDNSTVEANLGSRFHVARWQNDRAMMFRTFAGKTDVFHPDRAESWNALIEAETGVASSRETLGLARSYGLLLTLLASPDCRLQARGSSRSSSRAKIDVKARFTIEKNGVKSTGYARMQFVDGKLQSLESDLVPARAIRGVDRADIRRRRR